MRFSTINAHNTESPYPKPGVKAWTAVLVGALFFFFQFMQMTLFNSLSQPIMTTFAIDATLLGSVSSLFLTAVIFLALPAGYIVDRYSVRRLILANLALSLFGTWLMASGTSLWIFACGRVLTGVAHAFCFACCMKLANQYFRFHKIALASGLVVTVGMLGGIMAQTPLTLLLEHMGWQEVMLLNLASGGVIWLAILLFVFDAPHYNYHSTKVQSSSERRRDFSQVFKNKNNWLAGAYTGFLNLPIMILGALWGADFLVTNHGLSAEQASLVCSMLFLGTIVGSPLVGWICDRFHLTLLPMQIGVYASLILYLVVLFVPHLSFSSLFILFLFLGLMSSTQVVSYPLISNSNPKHLSGLALSVASVLIMGIAALFQPLVSALLDFWKHYHLHANYEANDFQLALLSIAVSFVVASFCCRSLKQSD